MDIYKNLTKCGGTMFDIILVLFFVIVIAGAVLVFGGNDDDDHTHRPHTGNMGDLW